MTLIDDGVSEGDETFSARIVEASEAILSGPPVVVGTIRDDD